MRTKVTFLLVIATMLLALTVQAQDVRQAFRKSAATGSMFSVKSEQMKGVKKKLTPQEFKGAKMKGDKQTLSKQKGNKQMPRKHKSFALPHRAETGGEPFTVPYDADFFASDEAMNDFIIINNNEDTSDDEPCTWKWSSTNGAYYSYNLDGVTPADDYLVLPVILEAGKIYEVTVNAAIWNYPEEFEVVVGTECTPEAMTTTIIGKTYPENDPADFTGIFTPTTDGVHYIAIHVTSEPDQNILSIYRFIIDLASDPAAPAAVNDLSVEQIPGELKNEVQFTAPTTSFGGDDLTDALTIEIMRNGELAATLTDVAPGSEQLYTDEVPAEGTYRYLVVASNAAGKGRKSNIVSVKVAMPQDIPYIVNFNDADVFDNFTILDNNNDGSTWGLYYHMVAGTVAAYNYDWNNDADDYFITQPLRLEAGKKYEVTIRAAASQDGSTERFEVVAGTSAKAEGLNIPVIEPTDVTSTDFTDYTGSFTAEESGIYNVAVHAISDANHFYLLVSDLMVELGAEPTAPAASELTAEAGAEGALTATIQVTAPTQCVDGSALTAISKVELYRNDKLIDQQDDVTPGAVLTFTDDAIPASGLYAYHAIAYNESGNGEKSKKTTVYVGYDQPDAPMYVEAIDRGTAIDFSWEDVTRGLNGGYVIPENISYDVWRLDVSPFYVFFQDKLASVTGQTSTTVDYNTDEGDEQDYTYFAVRTTNEMTEDEDKAAWSYTYLLTGKPYDMPINEGFVDDELHYFWESNGLLMISNYTSDDDGSALALLAEEPGNIYFMSGKLNLKDTTDPKLVFSALSPNISQLHIFGDTDDKQEWQFLQTVDLSADDYQTYQVPLSSLKNHERFANIVFTATYENAATTDEEGYIEDEGDYIFIDGIHIGDFQDNDLAVSAYAPESVNAGKPIPVTVAVENIGLQTASDYTVIIKAGEEEVFRENVAAELPSFRKEYFSTNLPTSVFDEAGDMTLTVTVTYDADLDNSNNSMASVVSIVVSDAAAPENLAAAEAATGVELSWTAPVTFSEECTEDFENGPGEFTQIDGNGDGYGWVYMNSDELLTHSGMGAMQSYSYVPEAGGVYVDNWLVTPLAILDGTFSFWAGAQDGDWTDEHFAVYVSTTGNESVDDFEQVSEEFVTTGFSTEYTVDLSSYAGQTGYIAIRHFNAYDQFAMVVDDISFIKAPAVPVGYNIYVDQQLVASVEGETTTYTVEADELTGGEQSFSVTAVYANGMESKPTTVTFASSTDIRMMIADGKPVDVYSVDGRLLRSQATTLEGLKGVFIINGQAVMVK